ncbi:MAG TPA: hypothetical protein PL089_14965 [Ignavibacteria bacterium]|nr:hypothetical protein [Ignavibacteria bacterium]
MNKKIVTASTVGQGVRTAGGVGADFIAQPIINDMMFIAPFQTPFLNYLFLNKSVKWEMCAHTQGLCEIAERELTPNMDTVTSSAAGGSATIVITPENPLLYVVGKSVMFGETDESGIVTAVTSTTFTATRDVDSSGNSRTWTAPSAGSDIHIAGEAHGENDSPPESVYMNPYLRKTRVQLFQKTIKMTDMMYASTTHGGTRGGNYWDDEMRDKAASMKIDMEDAFWINQNHMVTTSGTPAQVKTKTEGVFYQIANNGGFGLQYGSTADRADVKEFLRLSRLGSKKKTFFVGGDLMNDIEDAIEDKYSNTESITRYGPIAGDDVINVLRWRTNNIVVDIIRNPQWSGKYAKWGALLDDNYVKGYYYANDRKGSRKFRLEQAIQANGQPREEAQYLSHVGVGIASAPVHGILKP